MRDAGWFPGGGSICRQQEGAQADAPLDGRVGSEYPGKNAVGGEIAFAVSQVGAGGGIGGHGVKGEESAADAGVGSPYAPGEGKKAEDSAGGGLGDTVAGVRTKKA